MKRFLAMGMMMILLVGMLIIPATSMAANNTAVVHGGWLRLRAQPSFSAQTISSYYTGTVVTILSTSSEWYRVQTPDGRTGYMYRAYLTVGGGGGGGGTGNATVWSANGYGVRMRSGPGTGYRVLAVYSVGTNVNVLERGSYWSRIQVGSRVGYMMNQFLTGSTPSPTPTPGSNATVWSANGYGVRLRTGPSKGYSIIGVYSVGTSVAVIQKGPAGGWDYIQIGSRVGYMMNEFLRYNAPVSYVVSDVVVNTEAPIENNTITATAMPAGVTASYQWYLDGTPITNGNQATITVPAGSAGGTLMVVATGTGSSTGSASHIVVNPIITSGLLATVTINLQGVVPVVGDVLKVTNVTPAGATYSCAWYHTSDMSTVIGTGDTLTVANPRDVGKQLVAVVTGTGSFLGAATSAATGAVVATFAGTVTPTVTNTTTGSGLPAQTANTGDILKVAIVPEQAQVTYAWKYNVTVGGVAQPEIILSYGNTCTVPSLAVNGTNPNISLVITGVAGTAYASAGTTVSNIVTAIVSRPTISRVAITGDMLVGQTLTAVAYGTDGVTPVAAGDALYEWLFADGTSAGPNGNTLALTAVAHLGKVIKVRATGQTNYAGSKEATGSSKVLSALTSVTYTKNPDPIVVGSKLTATALAGGANAQATYQWYKGTDTSNLSKANSGGAEYQVIDSDIQNALIFVVRATGIGNYTGTVNSTGLSNIVFQSLMAPMTLVVPVDEATVDGENLEESTDPAVSLKVETDASLGSIVAATVLNTAEDAVLSYEWFLNDQKVSDWNKNYYPVLESDYGMTLKVQVQVGDSADLLTATLALAAPSTSTEAPTTNGEGEPQGGTPTDSSTEGTTNGEGEPQGGTPTDSSTEGTTNGEGEPQGGTPTDSSTEGAPSGVQFQQSGTMNVIQTEGTSGNNNAPSTETPVSYSVKLNLSNVAPGDTLKVSITPNLPEGTLVQYVWYVGNDKVYDAHYDEYTVKEADAGRKITVFATIGTSETPIYARVRVKAPQSTEGTIVVEGDTPLPVPEF